MKKNEELGLDVFCVVGGNYVDFWGIKIVFFEVLGCLSLDYSVVC